MFSLKFDLLFPTFQAAKDLARKLNDPRRRTSDMDPRELQRMQDELRRAREKMKAELLQHRYHVL